jgi:hypothetical protein
VPVVLAELVDQLLDKSPLRRPQTALDVARRLRALEVGAARDLA